MLINILLFKITLLYSEWKGGGAKVNSDRGKCLNHGGAKFSQRGAKNFGALRAPT